MARLPSAVSRDTVATARRAVLPEEEEEEEEEEVPAAGEEKEPPLMESGLIVCVCVLVRECISAYESL